MNFCWPLRSLCRQRVAFSHQVLLCSLKPVTAQRRDENMSCCPALSLVSRNCVGDRSTSAPIYHAPRLLHVHVGHHPRHRVRLSEIRPPGVFALSFLLRRWYLVLIARETEPHATLAMVRGSKQTVTLDHGSSRCWSRSEFAAHRNCRGRPQATVRTRGMGGEASVSLALQCQMEA